MSGEILCTARTRDELAECFAAEVARQYKSHLEYWQTTAVDDKEEYAMWGTRIQHEPDTVRERVLNRIRSVMANPQYYRKYFRKVLKVFVDWDVIRIIPQTGFYQNLMARDITNAFSINVEYLINLKDMTVVKIVHSERVHK